MSRVRSLNTCTRHTAGGPAKAQHNSRRRRRCPITRDRAAAGDAVVVVLHDLNLAAGYADQVAVLSRGALAAYGVPEQTLTADLLSEVYRHPVLVWPHPETTAPVILPSRRG